MNRCLIILASMLFIAIVSVGCSGNGANPVTPSTDFQITDAAANESRGNSQTHLWGFYDIYIDVESQTVTSIPNRDVMFTANVVNFINSNPANLTFNINDTPTGTDYVDVDIDVTIKHPFPGLTQYNGYDVRGIFMGDGSATLATSGVVYPVPGTDQLMFPDPDDLFGGPDGYSRWYNYSEFSTGGMPLFQYTPGAIAAPGFAGSATLNPYKYYADGLDVNENLWTWLDDNADLNGVFSAGASNTRNYYLRFPNDKGVDYGYAIIASWKGEDGEFHPSNAPEAVACSVVDNSTVYYADPSDNGGDIDLDISVWDWDSTISSGMMEDYKIFIESTVLNNPYEFNASDMIPTGGTEDYSTFHVELTADNIQGNDGNEYWVIVEQQNHDYTNEFGVTNLADTDPLTAYFRYDLDVPVSPSNQDPICDLVVTTSMPVTGFSPVTVTFDASGSVDPDGDPLTFEWDFDGDGFYEEDPDDLYTGDPDNPTHEYTEDYVGTVYVKVKDDNGGESVCEVDVDVTAFPSKNIVVTYNGANALDIAVDHSNGDLIVLYDNGHVRRYTIINGYQSSTEFTCNSNNLYIDMSPIDDVHNEAHMVTGYCVNKSLYLQHFNGNGTLMNNQSEGYSGDGVTLKDVMGCGSNGVRSYYQIGILCWYAYGFTGYWKGAHINGRDHSTNPPYGWNSSYINNIQWGHESPNPTMVYAPWLKGVESDQAGDYMWYLEEVDCTASRWNIPTPPTGPGMYYTYAGPYFGASGQPGDGDDRIFDPLDLTRDNQNHYYILDHLSTGDYILKTFSYTPSLTTALGSFGDSDDWNYTPLRTEGSDFNGNIIVLHTDGNDAMVSVFTEDETP